MKRIRVLCMIVFVLVGLIPCMAYANMSAPKEADIGSAITFEKHEAIAVVSEVLDIVVSGAKADIVATYTMENTTAQEVVTQSMFLSPNIESSNVSVVVNKEEADFTAESYVLNYGTEIQTHDWQYVVLVSEQTAGLGEEQTVDTITFEMSFDPYETYEVVVSYTYNLGGYPEYDFDAKRGEIEYYLAPAAMWKGFSNLTINLYLDKDMPVITSSNLDFKKVGTRTYRYTSDTLPTENLRVVIDENWYQNIISTLRSPYLLMTLMMFSPFIIGGVILIVLVIFVIRKRVKDKKGN